jgi:hypothetical protein
VGLRSLELPIGIYLSARDGMPLELQAASAYRRCPPGRQSQVGLEMLTPGTRTEYVHALNGPLPS